MATVERYEWDDGTELLFEGGEHTSAEVFTVHQTKELTPGGLRDDVVGDSPVVSGAVAKLEDLVAGLKKVADELRAELTPQEIALQASITLSGEVGWVVAKSKAEAGLQVTLTWKLKGDS